MRDRRRSLGTPSTDYGDFSEFRPMLDLAKHERVYLKISGFHHFSRAISVSRLPVFGVPR